MSYRKFPRHTISFQAPAIMSSSAMNGGGFDAFGNPTGPDAAAANADVNWASNDAFASAFDEPKSAVRMRHFVRFACEM